MVKCNGDSVLAIIRDHRAKAPKRTCKWSGVLAAAWKEHRGLQAANIPPPSPRGQFQAPASAIAARLPPVKTTPTCSTTEHWGAEPAPATSTANIKESAQHLSELLNDVLDFSDFKNGRLKLKIEPINVEEACQVSLRQITPLAQGKGLTIVTTFDAAVSTIQVDEKRFDKILDNLLSNAGIHAEGRNDRLEVKGDASPYGKLLCGHRNRHCRTDPSLFEPLCRLPQHHARTQRPQARVGLCGYLVGSRQRHYRHQQGQSGQSLRVSLPRHTPPAARDGWTPRQPCHDSPTDREMLIWL